MSPGPPASERRVHPIAVVDRWVQLFRMMGVYALVPMIGGLINEEVPAALVVAVSAGFGLVLAIGALAWWLRFRYELTEDALVVRGGVFQRFERVIPRARIQSIDTVERLRHRLFGMVELRVETLGGGETEGKLPGITHAEALRIREHLLPATVADRVREVPPLVRLTAGDLLLSGLTGGRVAVVGILLGMLTDVLPDDLTFKRFSDSELTALALAGLIVAVVAVVLVISLVATVLVYWGFTVRREGDRLVIERGLLERRRAVVPLKRVQAWRIEQNLIRRVLGLATVTVKVAGYAGQSQEVQVSSVLLPLGRRARAVELVSGLLPDPIALDAVPLEAAPRRALRRRVVRGVLAGAAVGTGTAIAFGAPGALGFVAVVPLAVLAWPAWRALGHGVAGGYLVVRAGLFVLRTTVVPLPNIQILRVEANPLQRLNRLGSLVVKVPKSAARALDLDRARAEERFAEVRAAIEPAST